MSSTYWMVILPLPATQVSIESSKLLVTIDQPESLACLLKQAFSLQSMKMTNITEILFKWKLFQAGVSVRMFTYGRTSSGESAEEKSGIRSPGYSAV